MTTDVISRDILIHAAPATVYDVVSTPEHMSQWFAEEATFAPEPGTHGVLTWTEHGEQTRCEITIVTADPPHRFAFAWISPERQREGARGAEKAVLVEFHITAEADGTRLVVSESGLDAVGWDDVRQAAYAADHHEGWEGFLTRLRIYAEGLATKEVG